MECREALSGAFPPCFSCLLLGVIAQRLAQGGCRSAHHPGRNPTGGVCRRSGRTACRNRRDLHFSSMKLHDGQAEGSAAISSADYVCSVMDLLRQGRLQGRGLLSLGNPLERVVAEPVFQILEPILRPSGLLLRPSVEDQPVFRRSLRSTYIADTRNLAVHKRPGLRRCPCRSVVDREAVPAMLMSFGRLLSLPQQKRGDGRSA